MKDPVISMKVYSESGWETATGDRLYEIMADNIMASVDDIELIFREELQKLYTELISLTPVDSGSARHNWRVSVGNGSTSFLVEEKPVDKGWNAKKSTPEWQHDSPSRAVGDPDMPSELLRDLLQGNTEVTVTIYNNSPYLIELDEKRHSGQSDHFIAQALQDFEGSFNKRVQELLR